MLGITLFFTVTIQASATEIVIPSMKNIIFDNNFNNNENTYGWILKENNWYYIDEDGSKHIGLLIYNGNYYYFDKDGNLIDNLQ